MDKLTYVFLPLAHLFGYSQMPIGIRPINDFAFKKVFGTPANKEAYSFRPEWGSNILAQGRA